MRCPRCRAAVPVGSRLCPNCGNTAPAPPPDRDLAWTSLVLGLVAPSFTLLLCVLAVLVVSAGEPGDEAFVILAAFGATAVMILIVPAIVILGVGAVVTGTMAWCRALRAPNEYGGRRLAQIGIVLGVLQLAAALLL